MHLFLVAYCFTIYAPDPQLRQMIGGDPQLREMSLAVMGVCSCEVGTELWGANRYCLVFCPVSVLGAVLAAVPKKRSYQGFGNPAAMWNHVDGDASLVQVSLNYANA